MNKKIDSFVFYDNLVSVVWNNKKTQYLSLSKLRKSCPCAFCGGEKDVFGNKFGGLGSQGLQNNAFVVKKYSFVGLYGVRFFWEDGHSDGIYTFDLIDSLCNEKT